MQNLEINNLEELRAWLSKNYAQKESVWLMFYKKSSGKADFAWSEIVDTLLCFGWIDSLPGKVDEHRTKLRISPRNPKSNWSRINKEKVARLIERKLMHENGLQVIEVAKQNGSWTGLDDVENLILPADLESFLILNNKLELWEKLSKSVKRGFLEQLLSAKKAETRSKKIQKFAAEVIAKIDKL